MESQSIHSSTNYSYIFKEPVSDSYQLPFLHSSVSICYFAQLKEILNSD